LGVALERGLEMPAYVVSFAEPAGVIGGQFNVEVSFHVANLFTNLPLRTARKSAVRAHFAVSDEHVHNTFDL
jgi:hypothetical protein